MVKVPRKTLERTLFGQGYDRVIGVDEVGMGCLAGPVVVCAVAFTKRFYDRSHPALAGVRDSKLLQAHQREAFARELIADRNLQYAVSVVYPREIDKLNIFQSSRVGMRRVIAKLKIQNKISNIMVLIDGPHRVAGLSHEQTPIVKGDRKIFAIACASIIAKVHRDAMMVRYAKRFPGYAFERHKGYGTALHRTLLAELGPCPLHRRSFRGVVS